MRSLLPCIVDYNGQFVVTNAFELNSPSLELLFVAGALVGFNRDPVRQRSEIAKSNTSRKKITYLISSLFLKWSMMARA